MSTTKFGSIFKLYQSLPEIIKLVTMALLVAKLALTRLNLSQFENDVSYLPCQPLPQITIMTTKMADNMKASQRWSPKVPSK